MSEEQLVKENINDIKDTIDILSKENLELRLTIAELTKYIEKMSYAPVVDNPKKDLVKILKRGHKE